MSKVKLNNISDLRREVANVFMDLREKKIEVHDAATLAKLADTMITSSKVELDYNRFSDTQKVIDFLETENVYEVKPNVKLLNKK